MQQITSPAYKTYLFEVPTGATPTNLYTFPDIPFLRKKLVYAIEACICTIGPSGTTALFQGVTNPAGFINLVDANSQNFAQNIPWQELRTETLITIDAAPTGEIDVYNGSGLVIFTPRFVALNKCSIYFPTPPTASRSMVFNVYYK